MNKYDERPETEGEASLPTPPPDRYRFCYRRAEGDDLGQRSTDWRNAVPITILAANETEARAKLFGLSAPIARHNRSWRIILDKVEAIE